METVLIVVMIPALVSALVLTIKAVYHMYFVIINASGRCHCFHGSLIWLIPSQSDEEVTAHKEALLTLLIGSALSWLVILLIMIVINVI